MTASGGQDSRKNHARIRASKALFALSSGLPYRIYDCASTPDLSGQGTNDARSSRDAIEAPFDDHRTRSARSPAQQAASSQSVSHDKKGALPGAF
ncbi:hypothetical protein ACVWZM_008408 [Bradyrhizobium sp. USDA 4501]